VPALPAASLVRERGVDAREQRVEAGLERGEAGDDADAHDGGDEAVLDRGGTRLVLHKASKDLHDVQLPVF